MESAVHELGLAGEVESAAPGETARPEAAPPVDPADDPAVDGAPFSAAMEREVCARVLGDRRHGLF